MKKPKNLVLNGVFKTNLEGYEEFCQKVHLIEEEEKEATTEHCGM